MNNSIDAVITWVNGNDTIWQEKLNNYAETKINFDNKKSSKRYNSIGEIDVAIKSIIKYAPFVKNIYLVTDDQKPEKFDDLKNRAKRNNIELVLVDHRTIFRGYEECLPTFNSCSIGCMLFRIPNLTEHFIVFNDDTFLMRETKPSDFFIDGKPIIRGKWSRFDEDRHLRNLYHSFKFFFRKNIKSNKKGFKNFQQTSAKLAGTKNYLRRFHTPVCIRKSTLESFFVTNKLLKENVKYRFRNKSQFIISSLSEHLEIRNKTFHFSSQTNLTYFRSYKKLLLTKLKLYLFKINKKKLFMTFQSLELANQKTQDYILAWINKRLD
ncbi:MAG: capsular biosynthesis protein [Winogradskyella sp.]|uniref:Stealth CR1 domain-containing protein n=1 Tax=Winogradskyella sp. TaxID=1883156 RepID=UPI0017F5F66E|nr:Stealth CR1 domain-containing protein [Winogradskyella sp.]MBT8245539.1 Stealth CR1 domain-containing protein [Winogradskyella sp.]NNK23924.1 capsular biosynthesis protein [Winogradskyella sp.]